MVYPKQSVAEFGAGQRNEAIERLAQGVYDIVVIGGGITGCGTALDAAARGLKVGLIERDDLASGTSSKSSKLVHGGARYLQSGQLKLVYQALAERQRLLHNAPHLVRTLDFLLPTWENRRQRLILTSGVWIYHLGGGFRIRKRPRHVNQVSTLAVVPNLRSLQLLGSVGYTDAQTDDARLTMYLARTAAVRWGADIATYVEAVGFEKDSSGQVVGVNVRDRFTQAEFFIRSRYVINASGVWSDKIRTLDEGHNPGSIRAAKGIHLILARSKFDSSVGVTMPLENGGWVFTLPWGNVTLVGTTDTDYSGDFDSPEATANDIDFLLNNLNQCLQEPVTHSDILATYAGLRPLVAKTTSAQTADLSRRHKLIGGSDGLITITGGKMTTYRVMAREAVDYAAKNGHLDTVPSPTRQLLLDGAHGLTRFIGDPETQAVLGQYPPDMATSLIQRHGTNALAVASLGFTNPDLAQRLVPDLPYVKAEVIHAVRQENTMTVADMLERRIRLSIEHRSRGLQVLDEVIGLMAGELGWDQERKRKERQAYVDAVRTTINSEQVTVDPVELRPESAWGTSE